MTESLLTAAIRFEPDGYDVSGARLMGRQSAGNGFLRAAVYAQAGSPLVGYGPRPATAVKFAALVNSIDPAATTRWLRSDELDQFNAIGVCHRPDPMIGPEARLRLRVGAARHCLCGVTHTLSSRETADDIVDYLTAPLMPWDALVCTSNAALETVSAILDEQANYLAWRFGQQVEPSRPQLPVIPLGVHCEDFAFSAQDRHRARSALGLADDEVAALYAGRLAIADKAHPFAMCHSLQAAVARTGKRVALILAGRFLNAPAEAAFRASLGRVSPDVRSIVVDGGRPDAFRGAWAAADLFVSAADSIQETFGLTPVEAMAAGLPAVVSDWNGYRDTVRDGVDGFRIKTWSLEAGAGDDLARLHEADIIGPGRYAWAATQVTSVDLAQLTDRLALLISDADLRRRMGEAGRARARASFDWRDVFRRYQALWAELNARRLAVKDDPSFLARVTAAPRAAANRLDPFRTFAHYPTLHVSRDTVVRAVAGSSAQRFRDLAELFPDTGLDNALVTSLMARLQGGDLTVADCASTLRCTPAMAARLVATLAKMGLARLERLG